MSKTSYFDRDLSWLAFNERVLDEAGRDHVPLMERFNFLSIYSSNLDEFYRVRMPVIMWEREDAGLFQSVNYGAVHQVINTQLRYFGEILNEKLVPALREKNILFHYANGVPEILWKELNIYFDVFIAGLLQKKLIKRKSRFFPADNKLYLAVLADSEMWFVNIPTDLLPRFHRVEIAGQVHIVFLEDIIRHNLAKLFPHLTNCRSFNVKLTREARLELEDDYAEGMLEGLEEKLKKRDKGFASRVLFEPGFPRKELHYMLKALDLGQASLVEGGHHHNLKDLSKLPIPYSAMRYPVWRSSSGPANQDRNLFAQISERDFFVHTPYQSFDIVQRFFNEAAIDPTVEEIYTSLYRVASDSRIAHALMSAALNGKKVTVVVELKARFDEANNIHWSKRMKEAGIRLIHSEKYLKVHAKVALVKRRITGDLSLIATGNLNEGTAKFYTDHILLTANPDFAKELLLLFSFLALKKKAYDGLSISFKHLLVARFNMQGRFMEMIDREISLAKNGLAASIIIKVNNLEEETLMNKLYEASAAGVQIQLLVRGICRLIPGNADLSENIVVTRIIDRFLEHGRVFIFGNNSDPEIFIGSSDWMNRNMFRRIEVCAPIYDPELKREIIDIIQLQLEDNVQATTIDQNMQNMAVKNRNGAVRSQQAIYHKFKLS